MTKSTFSDSLPECCRIGFASIDEYRGKELEQIFNHLPTTKTVIVVAHHIQDSLEWTWLKFPTARTGETHPADLHILSVVNEITNKLKSDNNNAVVVPYPGICDLMFKTVALPTKLGSLGDNFLFMNKDWGPWIHLRVILTDKEIIHTKPEFEEPCNHCGNCIEVCPTNALQQNSFDGFACLEGMREQSKVKCDGSFCFECELCLRACPIGTEPKEVVVTFKESVLQN